MDPRLDLAELQRTFVLPPGLRGPGLREVRLSVAGKAALAVAVAMLLAGPLVGAWVFASATRQANERSTLEREGVEAAGRATRLWRGPDKERRPMVAYTFAAAGRVYQDQSSISLAVWHTLKVGSTITVRYLPSDPSQHVVSASPPRVVPPWLALMVVVPMLVLGGGVLLLLRNQYRLLAEGRAAPAIVTRIITLRSSHGGSHRSITYDFPLLSGATRTGKSQAPRKPPAVGGVICVIYDPAKPSRSMPYPLPLVRPAGS